MKALPLLLALLVATSGTYAQDDAPAKDPPADDVEALAGELRQAAKEAPPGKPAVTPKAKPAPNAKAEPEAKAAPEAKAEPKAKAAPKAVVSIEVNGVEVVAEPGKPMVINPGGIGKAKIAVQIGGVPRPVVPMKKVVLKDFVMPDNFLQGPGSKTFINLNASPNEEVRHDELRFMDGGRISGTFQGISKDGKRLTWTNQYASSPIEFGIKGVAYAKLNPDEKALAERDLSGHAAIQFKNGDRIIGKILSLNKETLVLETWYAGTLEIERPMIMAINPVSSRALVMYSGPENLEGWTHGPNNAAWRVRAGDLEATRPGSIGLELPDDPKRVRIKFKARWTGYTTFNVAFCASDVSAAGGNYYKMSIRSGSFQLSRVTSDGSKSMWNFHNSQFSSSRGKTGYNYEILYDRKKKNFSLVVDGKVLKQWTETEGDIVSKKNGLFFSTESSNTSVKISDIEITHWDGKVPRAGAEEVEEKSMTSIDQVFFVNGDRLMGSVQGLDKGMLKLETEIGDVPVPVANVIEVGFGEEHVEQARRNIGDIRATFAGLNRSSITVQLRGMNDGKLKGYSEHFGEVEMPIKVFRRIEFNIYDDKIEEEEDDLYPF